MNAFTRASTVETTGRSILEPFLLEKANGRLVLFDKGPLAKALQETVGDGVFSVAGDREYFVEIKCEQKHTGNLFLETWSNRNLENRENHARLGSNPGWMHKVVADLLLYYFIDCDKLYVFDLFKLKKWAFVDIGASGHAGRIWDYREAPQNRYSQLNDTYGRIVPLVDLALVPGYRLLRPKQFTFTFAEEGFVV